MNMIDRVHEQPDLTGAQLETLFPTFVLSHLWPNSNDLNARLTAYAEAEMAQTEGMCTTTTNVGGWHSPKTLGSSENADVQTVVGRFDALVRELTARTANHVKGEDLGIQIDMWCNVNGAHHYNEPHVHRNCTWVGVYYADVPPIESSDPRAGALEVFDPRPASLLVATPGMEFDLTRLFQPQDGLMILFPSWLVHMVHPYGDAGRRISFASNIQVHVG